jgi:hypothetical protein
MSSLRRKKASRANGALSRGPRTPAGRVRSSLNAVRHGLLARCVLVSGESPQAFHALLAQYTARFGPVDGVELGFVEEMAAAFWRIRRAWAIEARLMDNCLDTQTSADPIQRLTTAFSTLAASPQLNLLHRYETRLHRMFQRSFHNLLVLRQQELPNEPSPISGHPGPEVEIPAPSAVSAAEAPAGAAALAAPEVEPC